VIGAHGVSTVAEGLARTKTGECSPAHATRTGARTTEPELTLYQGPGCAVAEGLAEQKTVGERGLELTRHVFAAWRAYQHEHHDRDGATDSAPVVRLARERAFKPCTIACSEGRGA